MIESYDFGRIVIDGVTYTSDVLIMGDKVHDKWWRQEGHKIRVSDMKTVLDVFSPQLVIIGTGDSGMMSVPEETREYFESKGIQFLAEKTKKACELFNSLSKSKRTLAGLHVTC